MKRESRDKPNIPQDAKVIFAFGDLKVLELSIVELLMHCLTYCSILRSLYCMELERECRECVLWQNRRRKSTANYRCFRLPSDWSERYRYTDFIDNMGDYYAATDLVVCRGGAGSLVEVCANGIASITSLANNLPGDHQAVNARVLEKLNATKVLYERVDIASGEDVESIEPKELSELVFELLTTPSCDKMGEAARTQYDSTTSHKCASIVGALLGDCAMPVSKEEPELNPDEFWVRPLDN